MITTKEIQKLLGFNLILKNHQCVAENISYLLGHEVDVMSLFGGFLYEYEVKISKSDFQADKKKKKFKLFTEQKLKIKFNRTKTPNYFSYVCPENLINIEEVPIYAGLYYIINNEIKEIKKPVKLHSHKQDLNKIEKKLLRVYQERHFLGCCLMTYKIRLINEKTSSRNIKQRKPKRKKNKKVV